MEVFKLLGTIALDNSDANKGMDETGSKAKKLQETMATAFDKVGTVAVSAGKTIAKGLAVGTAAMAGLVTKALGLGGQLEQNLGGSVAVFGENLAKSVQDAANQAYKNMGLSTSDYLATANKMGALFQGVNFSIEESAEIATKAMQRAADVASIMGVDTAWAMESIAGAAKGNFTMMDNLGVAINDTTLANYALEKGIQKSTKQMTTQEKVALAMELFLEKTAYAAGNYAKENETLAGSLGTAKAALDNFLSGSGDVDGLAEAFVNAANVIIKNVNMLLPKLVSGINQLVAQLMPYLPTLLNSLLPGLIEGAVVLITGLASALPELVSIIAKQLPFIMEQIGKAIESTFPALVATIAALIAQIDFKAVGEKIGDVFTDLVKNMPDILRKVGNAISDAWTKIVWPTIQGLFKAVFGVELPDWDSIRKSISNGWNNVIWPKIQGFFKQTFGIELPSWTELLDSIKALWAKVQNAISNLFTAIFGIEMPNWNEFVADIKSGWTNNVWPKIQNFFLQTFGIELPDWNVVWSSIKTWWSNVAGAFGNLFSAIFSVFTEDSDGKTVGERISGWWVKVATAVGDVFFAIFCVDPEDQSTVSGRIATWWRSVVAAVGDVFKAVFSILTQDSDGKSAAGRISLWWKSVLAAVGDVFKKVFYINTQDSDGKSVAGRIFQWWASVLAAIGDVFKTVFNVITDDTTGQTTSQKIASWWDLVMKSIGDYFKALFSIVPPAVSTVQEAIKSWWNTLKAGLALSVNYTVTRTEVTQKKTITVEEAVKSGATQEQINVGIAAGVVSTNVAKTFTSSSGTEHGGGSAKAFATGAVFKKPTIFSASDGWKMVGEAGAEAIAPIDVLQGYVSQAVANQNAGLIEAVNRVCEAIYTLDDNMGGNMRAALEDTKLTVNNREFARLVKAVN